jgi:UDP-N-acetylmuramoylalanine--D-glutamate ligase
MAKAAGIDCIVGGNIGGALLGRLGEIRAGTAVILEISHTQLQYTNRSPAIAAITNVTPNHLDQFSWDEYVGLKRNILAYQRSGDVAVLNSDDNTSRALVTDVRGTLVQTSIARPPAGDGAWVEDGHVMVRCAGKAKRVVGVNAIRLRGEHNLANVTMACAIGSSMGLPLPDMASAVAAFEGVPHRLEVVGTAGGATWVNDSIATSPERTVAGLRAFTEPVVLLLGGRDKHLPLDGLRELARQRCRAVICFGESGRVFHEGMADAVSDCRLVDTLADAVAAARLAARPGDVVLLSPAGTSFDAYPSFEVRGQAFRELVRRLPGFGEVQE